MFSVLKTIINKCPKSVKVMESTRIIILCVGQEVGKRLY